MLKRYFQPDDLDTPDANPVSEASNILEVGEFQLFQLGFSAWYGREEDPKQLEPVFFQYLLYNEVPHWARHYARKIIKLNQDNTLEHNAPEYHRFDSTSAGTDTRFSGTVKILSFGLMMAVIFTYLVYAAIDIMPENVKCSFPPCYWSEEEGSEEEGSADTPAPITRPNRR